MAQNLQTQTVTARPFMGEPVTVKITADRQSRAIFIKTGLTEIYTDRPADITFGSERHMISIGTAHLHCADAQNYQTLADALNRALEYINTEALAA